MAETKPVLGNASYDVAKDVATLYLPGIGVFYATLAAIWGLPYPVQVTGTVAAIATLLGVFLKISTTQYNKLPSNNAGTVVVNTTDPTVPDVSTQVNLALSELKDAETVTLTVVDQSEQNGVGGLHEQGRD